MKEVRTRPNVSPKKSKLFFSGPFFAYRVHLKGPFGGPKKIDPRGVDFFGTLFFDCFTSHLSCFREHAAPTGAAREPKLSRKPIKTYQKTKQSQTKTKENKEKLYFSIVFYILSVFKDSQGGVSPTAAARTKFVPKSF